MAEPSNNVRALGDEHMTEQNCVSGHAPDACSPNAGTPNRAPQTMPPKLTEPLWPSCPTTGSSTRATQ
eukprot:11209025-Lingulodinium_polyedra.AAC.1